MKLSEVFHVPHSVLGYLEWVSGLLYINATYESFQALALARSDVDIPPTPHARLLLQTLSHETYHLAQVVTTGYLFSFACEVFTCVSSLLEPPLDERRIQQLLTAPPRISDEYLDLVARLDVHSGNSLTDRAIIESAAFCFEYQIHYPNFSHQTFLEVLRSEMPEPTSEYRIAYELATEALGDRAIDSILPLCFVALCFESPNDAFMAGLEYSRSTGVPPAWDLAAMQQCAHAVAESNLPMGSAAEVMASGVSHPIYSPIVNELNHGADKVSPVEMMLHPWEQLSESHLAVVRPTLFSDGVLHVPTVFSDRLAEDSASDVIKSMAVLAAVAMRIGHTGESVSRYRSIT